jgi:Protein of unknown function (DUF2809)
LKAKFIKLEKNSGIFICCKDQICTIFYPFYIFAYQNTTKLHSIVHLKKTRIYYGLTFFLVIVLGILSRKMAIIPLCTGDLLYAVMIYVLVRIVFINKKALQIILISLVICYSIEFFQLCQDSRIIAIRKTLFGRYVLGQGFLWSDLLAYTFGIAIAFIIEKITLKYYNHESGFRLKQ